MSMTKESMAEKIITKVTAVNPNMTGPDADIIRTWLRAVCEGIIEEIQENGTIAMDEADFTIEPGTFTANGSSVVGQGINSTFSLTGKIE